MPVSSTYTDGVPALAYQVRTAAGQVLAGRNETRQFYAASTVKLAVLIAAYRLAEAGDLDLSQELASADTFVSQIEGADDYRLVPDDVDHGMPAPGEPISVLDLIERMIVVSSNEATNILLERLGFPAVQQVFADSDAEGIAMGRKYGDFAHAAAHGQVNFVSAAGLAAVMGHLVAGNLAGPQYTAEMLAVLGRQSSRLLSAELPDDRPWGSKDGSTSGIRHDVAYFGEPGPNALIVAVCTAAYERQEADDAITAVGRLAVELRAG